MTITLSGNPGETRTWIRRIERMTARKIDYVGIRSADGTCTCIITLGTKEDYPRQRIVMKRIDRSSEEA